MRLLRDLASLVYFLAEAANVRGCEAAARSCRPVNFLADAARRRGPPGFPPGDASRQGMQEYTQGPQNKSVGTARSRGCALFFSLQKPFCLAVCPGTALPRGDVVLLNRTRFCFHAVCPGTATPRRDVFCFQQTRHVQKQCVQAPQRLAGAFFLKTTFVEESLNAKQICSWVQP